MEVQHHNHQACYKRVMAVHDTMDVLGGKWKISILSSLGFGKKRYSEILKEVNGISGKMLSRELKDMEMNLLIKRTVLETQPVTVQYELTEYCENLMPIIFSLAEWGTAHRQRVLAKWGR
ncbi:winged helix-turn-helix transcriptional regulator [Olivibacter sitiensis]|uniref:winged helix-turn-helix transcriptional regulator n=1 Tax=Olivibacter sitiensis TaxID=376470 RepID=UPI00040163E0|nr:helix-turn-helix domain-containing protein [Olivibacter sitiensis]